MTITMTRILSSNWPLAMSLIQFIDPDDDDDDPDTDL